MKKNIIFLFKLLKTFILDSSVLIRLRKSQKIKLKIALQNVSADLSLVSTKKTAAIARLDIALLRNSFYLDFFCNLNNLVLKKVTEKSVNIFYDLLNKSAT
ncbi:hypothetical protein BpHYR1_008508 [Brachionus plicatilis]|uniref:Uncharacterized protein n=1 Tax=Brachionus plicatilis TaxID=10195 RepID=A0A3M7T4W1_BRAPC|nr:hypothetical protein BpHYR1_008508 [Brachionus plicatilis]